MDILHIAAHGFDAKDMALAIVRITIGTFFAISGFNKLFHEERHASLTANLKKNNIPCLAIMQWWVPGWEFLAGLMLVAGMMSAFAASVLIIICLVACYCEAAEKVEKYGPINFGDRIADYLYLPEVLYVILLSVTVLAGTGKYSLDYYLIPLGG
jgi:putative oxidoreductase